MCVCVCVWCVCVCVWGGGGGGGGGEKKIREQQTMCIYSDMINNPIPTLLYM